MCLPLISLAALGQQARSTQATTPVQVALVEPAAALTELPDAPSAQQQTPPAPSQQSGQAPAQQTGQAPVEQPGTPSSPNLLVVAEFPPGPLSARNKLRYFGLEMTDPGLYLAPLVAATARQVFPKHNYPDAWRQGASAFGKNYGDNLAEGVASLMGRTVTGLVVHEDPRYYLSENTEFTHRVAHALIFTLADRNDKGHTMPAVQNFAAAASGGFIGRLYLPAFSQRHEVINFPGRPPFYTSEIFPPGFRDNVHAGQRTLLVLAGYGASNLAREFDPEIKQVLRKLHIPIFVVRGRDWDRVPARH